MVGDSQGSWWWQTGYTQRFQKEPTIPGRRHTGHPECTRCTRLHPGQPELEGQKDRQTSSDKPVQTSCWAVWDSGCSSRHDNKVLKHLEVYEFILNKERRALAGWKKCGSCGGQKNTS